VGRVALLLCRYSSKVHLHLSNLLVVLLPLLGHTQQIEGVVDHLALDLFVEGAVRGERGGVVDLEEEWLFVLIEHDIDAKDLEGQGILMVVGVVAFVLISQVGHRCQNSLDGEVLDLLHELSRVDLEHLLEVPEHKLQRALAPDEVGDRREILHEAAGVLVYGVVRQVHLHILHVILSRL